MFKVTWLSFEISENLDNYGWAESLDWDEEALAFGHNMYIYNEQWLCGSVFKEDYITTVKTQNECITSASSIIFFLYYLELL